MLNKCRPLLALLVICLVIVFLLVLYNQRNQIPNQANLSIQNSNSLSQHVESKEESFYEKKVSSFNKLKAIDAIKKITRNEKFFLYLGRKNCPDCQEFVPKLYNLAVSKKMKVYYVDTMNSKDKELIKLRKKIGVETVPSFYFVSRQIVKLDLSREDLDNFVEEQMNG